MRKFWGIVLIVVGVVGFFFAGLSWLWQEHAMSAWVPVTVQVLSSEIKSHSGKSTTYSPEITYSFIYRGEHYQSSKVTFFNASSSYDWASGIVAAYPEGGEGKAYIDPENPKDSVLEHVRSFVPYALVGLTALAAEFGLGLMFGIIGGTRSTMLAVPLGEEGWQLLLPTVGTRKAFFCALLVLVGFVAVAGPVLGHYAAFAPMSDVGMWIMLVIAGVIGTVLAVIAVRRWSVTRHVSDARVEVRPLPIKREAPIDIRAECDAYRAVRVEGMRAKMRCVEHYRERRGTKTVLGTRTRSEQVLEFVKGEEKRTAAAGSVVGGAGQVVVPAEGPGSWNGKAKAYPYYTWEVRVEMNIAGAANYVGIFPLQVE